MKIAMKKFLLDTVIKAAAASIACLSLSAAAQNYPSKPVHLVVPWPPSGNVDITARTIAPALSDALGQQVIVDNRTGAAGNIAAKIAEMAEDDRAIAARIHEIVRATAPSSSPCASPSSPS